MIISGEFKDDLQMVFKQSYYMYIINFALLVVFWHQYTQTKLIFSEYISSVISIYTVLVGLAILHSFSYENDLLFEYLSQYFNAILYSIMTILLVIRLNYLNKPESQENENYIANYYLMQGFIEKPRKGILISFYSSLDRVVVFITILVLILLGIYLFSYDRFEVFIKLNILLLLLAIIISTILAIVTWHKRWYNAIGFLFKKSKLK
jgi:hypothetical protein